ncbi:hypothetical protein ABEO75_09870 [Paenibacillus macerans]|uniref:hypothetical protein n=1 Tax=Paenibacillus macerans TaxID=44252 RepID=UPI002E1B65B0|nr:hypothetical protein [Paenibacillus macerans]
MVVIKNLVKINIMSFGFAVMLSFPIQLLANIYRIGRVFGWDLSLVNQVVYSLIFIMFILFTIVFVILTRKYFAENSTKLRFISMVLWFPYFVLINFAFSSLVPIVDRGELPTPVVGLLSLGAMIIHPIYIFVINLLALLKLDNEKSS